MRFLVEHFRLSDDSGHPVTPGQPDGRTSQIVDGNDVEQAVASYLDRDGFEMVGEPSSFSGSRAVLTVRKGRTVYAVHVHPVETDDEPPSR